MTEQESKPAYRLAGICKKCHNFRFGYLLYGLGPFICYQCAEQAAKKIPAATNTPGGLYLSYTFTTSNSSSSMWGDTRI